MKTFFIQNEDNIKLIISFALIFNGLLIMIFYFYNKIAYKKIVDIYEKEIGPLPVTAIICKMQVYLPHQDYISLKSHLLWKL